MNLPDNRLCEPLSASLARVASDWRDVVTGWRVSTAGRALLERIDARRAAGATIYPADPLRALALTPRAAVRVVIVGQDPYHRPGQAEGLAFSVPDGVSAPPSLRNLLNELERDLGSPRRAGSSLAAWAAQGVLLLNTVLTVEDGHPASHSGLGWEVLTDALINVLSRSDKPMVAMLWGTQAAAKRPLFDDAAASSRQCVLTANHPSPLSARRGPTPFIGCGHFRKASAFLAKADPGRPAIDWRA